MRRAALYARVSKQEQASAGHVSLEQQLADTRKLAVERGYQVVLEKSDVLSGLVSNRKGYQELLEAARSQQFEVAIVWKWDRWGRDAVESLISQRELQQLGIETVSVMEPTDDPFMRLIYAGWAEQASRDTSQRVTRNLRERAARGSWIMGRVPPGYRPVRLPDGRRTLELDPETAPTVRAIFEAAASGNYSLRQLAVCAERLGWHGPQARSLSRTYISRLLRNPAYRGALVYGRKSRSHFRQRGPQPPENQVIVEDAIPALVDPELWALVQRQISNHGWQQGTVRNTPYLLTSLLQCGICGRRLYGRRARRVNGYNQYLCAGRATYTDCNLPNIYGPTLERELMAAVEQGFAFPPDVRAAAMEAIEAEASLQQDVAAQRRRQLEQRRADLARDRQSLALRYLEVGSAVPREVYDQLEGQYAAAIEVLNRELAVLPAAPALMDLRGMLEEIGRINWSELNEAEWRRVLTALIGRVEVRGQRDYTVTWQPAAEAVRRALANVSPMPPHP